MTYKPWGEEVLSPVSLPSLLELLLFLQLPQLTQKSTLIAEHLCCAKTRSHSTMKTAEAKEGALEVSLGPMWVSPPKVRCDHLQLPSHNPRPICMGPESHPDLNTQGSLGEVPNGWGWAGRRWENGPRKGTQPGKSLGSLHSHLPLSGKLVLESMSF